MRATAFASGGAGTSTVYFARMSLYAFSHEAAFCSDSHAVFTSPSISSKGGTRPGTKVSTNTRCQPKPDSTGPCHDPGGKLRDGKREARPELLAEKFRSAVAVILLEHERIGERRRKLRVLGLPGELRERAFGVLAGAGPAAVGRKVQVTEADPRRLLELVPVLLVPARKLGGRRFVRRSDVLGDELHLLRHPALDDGVVLVEAHRQPFAIEDLLLDPVLDQPAELLGRRLAPPLRLERERQLREFIDRQLDLLRRLDAAAPSLRVRIDDEQNGPEQQEVNERLAQPSFHRRHAFGAMREGRIADGVMKPGRARRQFPPVACEGSCSAHCGTTRTAFPLSAFVDCPGPGMAGGGSKPSALAFGDCRR